MVTEFSNITKPLADLRQAFSGALGARGKAPPGPVSNMMHVGIVGEALTAEQAKALSDAYPELQFELFGREWQDRYPRHIEILFVEADANQRDNFETALRHLKARPASLQIAFVLHNASVTATRMLAHEGAAEVIPAPVNEPSLFLSMERLMSRRTLEQASPQKPGHVVALLKAGGGVGATSVGIQTAIALAASLRDAGQVCFADLDLQFGTAALHFDMTEVLTISDCIAAGEHIGETSFKSILATHQSGVRLLAGPNHVVALDKLTPPLVDSLIAGLRRDFATTIIDLPADWTAWTNRALQLCDRIVLVSRLSVPHIHLIRRQLSVLSQQKLDEVPVTLVCNAVTPEQQKLLPIKEAERALGRRFQVVLPSDERLMMAASNEGASLVSVRRGTKLEAGVAALAGVIGAQVLAGRPAALSTP
jgi:pilus assembly protein CpaE